MALDVPALRESFDLVVEREPELTRRFYEILFDRYPNARSLFGRNGAREQELMLRDALVAVMDHIEDAPWLTETLRGLGRKHQGYGVTAAMFPWVGECLVATLAEVAGDSWTPRYADAWGSAYGAITELMLSGYEA